ncbi:hypothetical protein J4526_05510 [Desulfurococcaceae archaeon MEX13E-LK6-19]|nr:hypothetical protein J4526_05510 [Desulfurococcaceae archaeon MEX13E-LK6-19]
MFSFDKLKERKGVIKNIDYTDPVVKYRGRKVYKLAKILVDKEKLSIDYITAVDIFYTFYLPYPILKDPMEISDKQGFTSYKIISSMLSSKHIHDIRGKSVADSLLSSIAAGIFISELENELQESTGNAEQKVKDKEQGIVTRDETIKKVVERALSNTKSEIDGIRKLRYVIEGQQPGTVSMMVQEEYAIELIRLARNTEVKKILELISGVKPWSINIPKRKRRSKHGEITGYELGRDIERIVASNLALPDELFYLRFLEGRLLLNQKVLSHSMGPIYVLVDKCLPGDTLVYTSTGGLKPISEIRLGERILSVSPIGSSLVFTVSKVVSIRPGRAREVYKVETPMGTLNATGNHVVMIVRDNMLIETTIDNIDYGDELLMPTPELLNKTCRDNFADQEVILLGLLTGGKISIEDGIVTICFRNKNVIEKYKDVLSTLGNYYVYGNCISLPIKEKAIQILYKNYESIFRNDDVKSIPDSLTRLCGRSLSLFLAGVIDACGITASDKIIMVFRNGILARQIHLLLLKQGIMSRIIEEYGSKVFKITIDRSNLVKLVRKLPLRNIKHENIASKEISNDLEQAKKHDFLYTVPITSIKSVGEEIVYDITLENGNRFFANGFIVHNSGSMDGIKMVWAKAVALSLYMRALKEHREFYFRFFDSIPYPLVKLSKKPSTKQALKLMDYIASIKGSGGTDISRALMLACNDIRSGITKDVSDIVLITDGVDRIAESLISHNLRKANARLISVMIFGDNRSLKRLSTKYFSVRKLGTEEILKIVEA